MIAIVPHFFLRYGISTATAVFARDWMQSPGATDASPVCARMSWNVYAARALRPQLGRLVWFRVLLTVYRKLQRDIVIALTAYLGVDCCGARVVDYSAPDSSGVGHSSESDWLPCGCGCCGGWDGGRRVSLRMEQGPHSGDKPSNFCQR